MLENKTEDINGCLIVSPSGELNAQSASGLQALLMQKIGEGQHNVVISLIDLDFIASAGLRVLLIVARRMSAVSGRVALVEGSSEIMEVLEISGVKTLIPIFASIDAAVQSLA